MKPIKTSSVKPCSVQLPGSKSISHRMLICASLAKGRSLISNLLKSDDIHHTMTALKAMGAGIGETGPSTIAVEGFNGHPLFTEQEIYLGNSGTSMRLLAGIAALGTSPYIMTGDQRMQERPMEDLLEALNQAGIEAVSINGNGAPPVRIKGGNRKGGAVTIDCSQSSQYLSSLLMMGALFDKGLDIHLPSPAVSEPYIHLTMDIMKQFGVHAEKTRDTLYRVFGNQYYRPGEFAVEPDLSNASYFWAAGAVSGEMITVENINRNSLQGDLRLLDILESMGCSIDIRKSSIGVEGKQLTAVDVDMSDIPDVVPTLAVIAAFAKGETRIRNIKHLREKECDRIDAVVSQLSKMGVTASQGEDWLSVTGGGSPKGAVIETFNDHRIAMAFSIAGLVVPGMMIENEGCVGKSFPGFWQTLRQLTES